MKRNILNRILVTCLAIVLCVWLVVPLAMALLWSMVDPSMPWSYPDLFPKKLSFERWRIVWETTSLPKALLNSYSLAPVAGICTLLLAAPTAYAFGREDFRGKTVAQVLILIPLVLPGFVTAVFFSSLLLSFGIYNKYPAILLGHIVLFMPYAVRILTVSFSQVKNDTVNAARDLGASRFGVFRVAYLPILKPGIFAAFLIVFVLSIEEFAIAFIVGVPTFTTVPTILYSYLGFEFVRTNAAVVALILVVPNVMMMLVLERLLQSANPANVSGKG